MSQNRNTISTYEKVMRKFQTLEGFTKLEDYEGIIPLVFKHYQNIGTAKNIFSAIIWSLKKVEAPSEVIAKYSIEISRINKIQNRAAMRNRKTPKQIKNWVSWSEVLKVYEKLKCLKEGPFRKKYLRKFTILSLYVLFPPRRINDYALMVYTTKTPKDMNCNYYVLHKQPYFLFNNYKTSGSFGSQKFFINKDLSDILDEYIREETVQDGDLLLGMWSAKSLTRILQDIFVEYLGKKVSAQILRRSYLTFMNSKNKLKRLSTRNRVANMMSHNVTTALTYPKF